jgi:hypothetical protein
MSAFIITYFDQIVFAVGIIGVAIFSYPRFKAKLKDGFQCTDVTEAISEGVSDYKSVVANIETIAKDVTINDTDSVATIIDIIEKQKTFK